jgi:NADH dehydrogenase/NADH:ubiquinone oxidoreductase subunit G
MNPNDNKEPANNQNGIEEVTFDDKQQEKVNQLVSASKAKEKARADETIKNLTEQVNSIPDKIKDAIAKHDAEANMTDKEKSDAETAELKKQLAELKSENEHRVLVEHASNFAAEKGLPQSFAKLFVGSNDDETQQNLESVKTEFDNAVQESVEKRLKGSSTPQVSSGDSASVGLSKDDINKMSLDELTKLYTENPDLIKKDYLNK